MPAHSPTTAGTKASCPMASDCSMAGIRRLQTDAATMTPAAKPVRLLCTISFSCPLRKNTMAAPREVPRKGIASPCIISLLIIHNTTQNIIHHYFTT